MVYKLINEWRCEDGLAHEISVYKYNLNHDELIRYFCEGKKVRKQIYSIGSDPIRTELYENGKTVEAI